MWDHAAKLVPTGRAGDFNQALMDLGARICLPKGVKCSNCPIRSNCEAYRKGIVDRFPPPKVKRKVPEAFLACIASLSDGRVWLGKRPPEGLWGGLWELPTLATKAAPKQKDVEAWAGIPLVEAGKIRHVLTHRIVHLTVFRGPGLQDVGTFHYRDFQAFGIKSLEDLGTSRLTDKAIQLAFPSEL